MAPGRASAPRIRWAGRARTSRAPWARRSRASPRRSARRSRASAAATSSGRSRPCARACRCAADEAAKHHGRRLRRARPRRAGRPRTKRPQRGGRRNATHARPRPPPSTARGTPAPSSTTCASRSACSNVLADPNIAYILMMAGLLGLYIEFTHPGVVLPGVAGAISPAARPDRAARAAGQLRRPRAHRCSAWRCSWPRPSCRPSACSAWAALVAFVLGSLFLFDAEAPGCGRPQPRRRRRRRVRARRCS